MRSIKKVALVMAKLRYAEDQKKLNSATIEQFFRAGKTPIPEIVKFDLYELADLAKDEAERPTRLQLEILFPAPTQSEIVDRNCSN